MLSISHYSIQAFVGHGKMAHNELNVRWGIFPKPKWGMLRLVHLFWISSGDWLMYNIQQP